MELELGLKISQTRDDLSSMADLRISKDAGGVLFFSRETEEKFVLTGHLRGYRRKHIDIRINEDGTLISISGKKPVQEKVIQGWIVYKKEVELKGFTKVFQIPRGVILDKIKAKFNDAGSVLTISMPKRVKGISGEGIEEVKEAVGGDWESSGVRDEVDGMTGREREEKSTREETSTSKVEDRQKLDQETSEGKGVQTHEKIKTEARDVVQERKTNQQKLTESVEAATAPDKFTQQSESALEETDREEGAEEKEEKRTLNSGGDDGTRQEGRRKKFKICTPVVAGSALLVSLIVLVINLTKAKRR
ncbi:uncharacterized protein LOC116205544 [Punica granatum]|uniref:SHSP domain-containing protein n=2 Tax=Punica granatum TaxID=22663 RepID=A0A218XKP6_PUNGR|nr:uncharacterized protein LOC116205544 [Punica granatum]OWM85041.1 hypothetical protein CDL15_Pgr027828 [Punica granatum]PKI57428.1 hypothetical protein CRG98_022079 [Punica granatum]